MNLAELSVCGPEEYLAISAAKTEAFTGTTAS